MRRFITFCICLLSFFSMCFAQQSTEDVLRVDPRKAACSFYVYDYKDLSVTTPAPDGYKPFYISHFARHRARYCTSEYNRLYEWLTKARSAGLLTESGNEFLSRYEPFYQKVRYCSGNLTDLGKDQHRSIAQNMYDRFSEVFDGQTHVEASSTESPRVIMSMWSCLSQLVALDDDIDVDADASARHASWLQPVLTSNPYYIKGGFNGGKRAEREVSGYFMKTVPWKEIVERFFAGADVPERVLKISPETFITDLHAVVTGTYCLDEGRGCFDDVFSADELYKVWKGISARYFLRVATYEGSENLTLDYSAFTAEQIIDSAEADIASGDTQLRLRFGHDTGIAPLLVFLGVDGCGQPASSFDEGIEIFPSYNVPMGASLQLVFYTNAEDDILVKVLVHEKEAYLPLDPVQGPYYRWDDFKEYYRPRIAVSKEKIEKRLAEQSSLSSAVNYGPSDSLAFVNASWKVTQLDRGATAMYAKLQMFNSVQSISVVKYPAADFRTEILHRPGSAAGKPSEIGKETGAAFVMNAGYFNVKELVPCVYYRIGKEILGTASR